MSYIGNQSENKVSPAKIREYVTGTGSATTFDLSHDVPGYHAESIMVVVNNVIQEPAVAYTIANDANGRPRRLDFGAGNALATTDTCYVIYQSSGQLYHTPPANSVGYAQLETNLRSGRVDQFLGSAGASSNTVFTLTETALNVNSVMVYINGIYQRPTSNYTVSGTALTFTASLSDTDEVDIHHMSIRSTVSHVSDGSVSLSKIASSGISSQGASKPTSPFIGQNWFNINSGVTYQYINDGTSNLWLDMSSSGIGTSVSRGVDYVGDVDPASNHNGGSATLAIGQVYYNRTNHGYFVCTNATNNGNVWVGNYAGFGGTTTDYLSGGTNYRVHTFLSSGTFTTTKAVSVDYLVVAGGGGGGGGNTNDSPGGGGGAGGYRFNASPFALTAGTTFDVTVGDGGIAGIAEYAGGNGTSSVFSSITSAGGGGGGSQHASDARRNGKNGGSGGGASRGGSVGVGNTPSTSPVQGFNGGTGVDSTSGGGGGGAAAVGANATSSAAGNGGAGLTNVYRTGSASSYAGGGGGSKEAGGSAGTGSHGGGSGVVDGSVGGAGTVNTGGGGAGGGGTGGVGGIGIVIVRYALT